MVVETFRSGTTWYRLYKSKWIEQGGTTPVTATSLGTGSATHQAVAFSKPMRDTNYSVQATVNRLTTTIQTVNSVVVQINSKTVNGVSLVVGAVGSTSTDRTITWEAKGFSA
jgi:hypothetical protein